MKFRLLLLLTAWVLQNQLATAAIKTETVEYEQGGTKLEGFLAYDDAGTKPRPGVLLVHDWMGVGDYAKSRAKQLAELGYVAFAADIYGKGVRPADPKAAGELAGKYKDQRPLFRERLKAGLAQLEARKEVAPGQVAAIGYCFGGTGVLELGRSGAEVKGIVTFHGGLSTPTPEDAKNIKCPVLVLHGADDPFVKPAEVAAFKEEMAKGRVKYEFVAYPGAVHSFTRPDTGSDNSKGAAYNKEADEKSWAAMQKFFGKIFKLDASIKSPSNPEAVANGLSGVVPVFDGYAASEKREVEVRGDPARGDGVVAGAIRSEQVDVKGAFFPDPHLGNGVPLVDAQLGDAPGAQRDFQDKVRELFFRFEAPSVIRLCSRHRLELHRRLAAGNGADSLLLKILVYEIRDDAEDSLMLIGRGHDLKFSFQVKEARLRTVLASGAVHS